MKRLIGVVLAAVLGVAGPVYGQAGRATSDPYKGDLRTIFDAPERAKNLEIERVMDLLHIVPGKTVADIGAGSGWFTMRAARRVTPSGTVIGEDINPDAVKYVDERAKKEGLGNVRVVLGTPDDPKLGADTVNSVLLLKVYHEIANPVFFMQHLRGALRAGARVGIIDRTGNGSGTDHGVPEGTVEKEMGEAGYKKVGKYDFTKKDGQDYFLIFEVKVGG